MDSLTQMLLGAAVGEATLGKKIGNRAMVWGAIAGTIPDLDVAANLFMSPIDALSVHRGITHSIVFCLLAALLMGWIVPKMYKNTRHKSVAMSSWIVLALLSSSGLFFVGGISTIKTGISVLLLTVLILFIIKRYKNPNYSTDIHATTKDWQWMFWWSFITHPLLDCFTTYGTQILLPFSDKRVAFNNIAVADPLYTIPLMLGLLIAMSFPYTTKFRATANRTGIAISSFYMIFTIANKQYVNSVFVETLEKEGLNCERYMTTPTILNNVLWSGIAERDTCYYYGHYSLFDKENSFKINTIRKNHELIDNHIQNDYTLRKLSWFSDGYFSLEKNVPDKLKWYDLRFGTFRLSPEEKDEFVFHFDLDFRENNYILLKQPTRPRDGDTNAMMSALWTRVKGE
jgi:inner membrane protein